MSAALHAALDRLAPDFVEVSSPWRSPSMVARWRPEVPKALVMHADPLAAYAYRWLGPVLARDTIDRQVEASGVTCARSAAHSFDRLRQ